MNAEQIIMAWIKSEILTPKKLTFESTNMYYEELKPVYENIKKEGLKVENRKKIIKEKQRKN